MNNPSRRGALKMAGVLASLGLSNSRLGHAVAANAATTRADVLAAQASLGGACVSAFPHLTPSFVRTELARMGFDGATDRVAAKRISQKISYDFEAGRMLQVDGWYLAQTEILIYAQTHYDASVS
jgi:hypothetical protein